MAQQTMAPFATQLGAVHAIGSNTRGLRAPALHTGAAARHSRSGAFKLYAQQKQSQAGQRAQLAAAAVAASAALSAAPVKAAEAAATAASSGVDVDSVVSRTIDAVKAGGVLVKRGLEVAGTGVQYAQGAYEKVAPVVKDAADKATPVVKRGLQTASDLAGPALSSLKPTVEGGLGEAQKLLAQQGVDTQAVAEVTRSAAGSADQALATSRPLLQRAVTFLTTTDPVLLAEYGAGAFVAVKLGPPILKGLGGLLRGYGGEVTAAKALDAASNDGNTYIIDLRTQREKENSGVVDLPASGRYVELEYAAIDDRKLRGQLRNAGDIENEVTAMQVASLKRVNKKSTLLLLDRNGSVSKVIAKLLASKGYSRTFVIAGGFEGRNGWTSSKLPAKLSSSVSGVEVLPPVLASVVKRTTSTRTQQGSQGSRRDRPVSNSRALPSGR